MLIEFDGPRNFHCLGVRYSTLTHGGLKEEGQPIPGGLCETAEDAQAKFDDQLATFLAGAEQVAWRRRPQLDCEDGRYKVTARLARYPEEVANG